MGKIEINTKLDIKLLQKRFDKIKEEVLKEQSKNKKGKMNGF